MFRRAALVIPLLLATLVMGPHTAAAAPSAASGERAESDRTTAAGTAWSWPLAGPRLMRPFSQPPHRYGPGHRGIDLLGTEGTVRAPADGVVAFAGVVVDRPVLTIEHGGGLVSSFEPVTTTLRPGTGVARGEPVGQIAAGGHGSPGVLHLGARVDGEYVNPLLLLGGVPRAVLLPCC